MRGIEKKFTQKKKRKCFTWRYKRVQRSIIFIFLQFHILYTFFNFNQMSVRINWNVCAKHPDEIQLNTKSHAEFWLFVNAFAMIFFDCFFFFFIWNNNVKLFVWNFMERKKTLKNVKFTIEMKEWTKYKWLEKKKCNGLVI